jgi:hypothetical protein
VRWFAYTHIAPSPSRTTAELATIVPPGALSTAVVGTPLPHGKAVTNPSAHGSTLVTVTIAAAASPGTPFVPATGIAIIRAPPSLPGRSRVSSSRTGGLSVLTPPAGAASVAGGSAGGVTPETVVCVHRVGGGGTVVAGVVGVGGGVVGGGSVGGGGGGAPNSATSSVSAMRSAIANAASRPMCRPSPENHVDGKFLLRAAQSAR